VAERKGCLLIKLQHGVVGMPDRLLLRPGGTCAFIEFKRPDGKVTKIQKFWLEQLNWLGFRSVVVRNLHDFDKVLTTTT
jgi:hypothetical protein